MTSQRFTFACSTYLINKSDGWPSNYHRTARTLSKSSAPPHSMNRRTQSWPAILLYFHFCYLATRAGQNFHFFILLPINDTTICFLFWLSVIHFQTTLYPLAQALFRFICILLGPTVHHLQPWSHCPLRTLIAAIPWYSVDEMFQKQLRNKAFFF